ncbi:MAG: hypothetical protein D6748_02905 [Calditrichaeota bacterium]|nr:MAG: hypothetical protein D6748_02905 [Calditrichota bacterium]
MGRKKKLPKEEENEWQEPEADMDELEDEDLLDDEFADEEDIEEDFEEVEEIEAKIQSGESIGPTPSEVSLLLKNQVVYSCPRCRKIYFRNKWIKDTVTDIYTLRTEYAYCNNCLGKTASDFVGVIEIYDKELEARKDSFVKLAKNVESRLENRQPFEKIIKTMEQNGVMYIFCNTTRLAVEIAKAIRYEYHGAIQYEWFERNQFVRAKWFSEIQNREYFKNKIRAAKERRLGMFSFEDDI